MYSHCHFMDDGSEAQKGCTAGVAESGYEPRVVIFQVTPASSSLMFVESSALPGRMGCEWWDFSSGWAGQRQCYHLGLQPGPHLGSVLDCPSSITLWYPWPGGLSCPGESGSSSALWPHYAKEDLEVFQLFSLRRGLKLALRWGRGSQDRIAPWGSTTSHSLPECERGLRDCQILSSGPLPCLLA